MKELITDQEINKEAHDHLFTQFTKILDINLENKTKKRTIYIASCSQTDPVKFKEVIKSREKGEASKERDSSMSR